MQKSKKPVRRRPRKLPAPAHSGRLLATLAPGNVGLFRFLLEGYDNLAFFTVLDRREALLKLMFSPHQAAEVRAALDGIAAVIPLQVKEWPVSADNAQALA